MNFAIVIPAQENNKYHQLGDLAPFGDTTLLEWKIAQCKEFASSTQIYISSGSQLIEEIALKENVNFIQRNPEKQNDNFMLETIEKIDEEIIMWINPTSPFLNAKTYQDILSAYEKSEKSSLITVNVKKEYAFFEKRKLNFEANLTPRNVIEPVYIMTNGCYLINQKEVLRDGNIVGENPDFYELDAFSSIEIKDIEDYTIANDLISIYFKREFDV